MKRSAQTRSGRRVLVVVLALLFAATPARSDQVADGTHYCDGRADPALGEGAFSQVGVHSEVFSKAFAKACPKEAGLLSYLGTGDRGGINALLARRRAFGAGDVPLTPDEKASVELGFRGRISPVHQIPLFVQGWAIAYNIPCSGPQVNFRSKTLALIYARAITRWDDPILALDNPWLSTCRQSIRLTKRADTAGATVVFQDYLSKRNPEWLPYRRGLAGQQWPTLDFSCSGLGDRGIVSCVNSVRGSIGYVSIREAKLKRLKVGMVENAAGSFAAPTAAGCTAAAATAITPPGTSGQTVSGSPTPWFPATQGDWSTVSITDAPDVPGSPASYPMCSFSYIYVLQWWYSGYGNFSSQGAVRTVVDYFTVALSSTAQARLAQLGYGSLPPRILEISRDGIRSVSFYRLTTAGF